MTFDVPISTLPLSKKHTKHLHQIDSQTFTKYTNFSHKHFIQTVFSCQLDHNEFYHYLPVERQEAINNPKISFASK
jgi:hypothetical protein